MSDEVKRALTKIVVEELIGERAPSIGLAEFHMYADGLSNSTLCAFFNTVLEEYGSDLLVRVTESYWFDRPVYGGVFLSLVHPDGTFRLFTIECFDPGLTWVQAREGEDLERMRQLHEDHLRKDELAALAAQDLTVLLELVLERLTLLALTNRLNDRDRRVIALLTHSRDRLTVVLSLCRIYGLSISRLLGIEES